MPRRRKRAANESKSAPPVVPEAIAEIVPAHSGESGVLLTRTEAAKVLGVSVSTVIRNEHRLKPVVVNGLHKFDETVLRREVTTIRQRQVIASLAPTGGEVAAAVFELSEADVEPTEIVIPLKVPPDVVSALRAQWLEMRRASACKKCGERMGFCCRTCLEDLLDAPCPTCSRKCPDCGEPLRKGKFMCRECGKWAMTTEENVPSVG